MTIDRAADVAAIGAAPSPLSTSARRCIFLYLGMLIVLLAFGGPSGGLIDIPISFLLKNRLHLEAHEVARFRLFTAIPLYLSFVFGFIRDTWNPLGTRDCGFMLLFGGVSALLYVCFAFAPMTYSMLLVAVVVLTASFLFVASAQNGLTTTIGQQHAMTGQISAVWNVFLSVPTVAALLMGGMLSGMLETESPDRAIRILFLVGAAVMAAIALYALWKPKDVFDNVHAEHGADVHPVNDMKRLLGHWPIYPALLIWLLWNFAPGSTTPLPISPAKRPACHRRPMGPVECDLRRLLHSDLHPLRTAMPQVSPENIAVVGNRGRRAANGPTALHPLGDGRVDRRGSDRPDGRRRDRRLSRPDHAVVSARSAGNDADDVRQLYFAVTRFGDVLGTTLYDHYGGFTICVIAITIVYAMILPALLLVPENLAATADGQVPELGRD